jgi:hypothetical protein
VQEKRQWNAREKGDEYEKIQEKQESCSKKEQVFNTVNNSGKEEL